MTLMRLPPELRDRIWDFVVDFSSPAGPMIYDSTCVRNITRRTQHYAVINSQLAEDFTGALLRQRVLNVFHFLKPTMDWLSYHNQARNIRSIEVPYNLYLHYGMSEIAPEIIEWDLPFPTVRPRILVPNWYEENFQRHENLFRPGGADMFELFDMCGGLKRLTLEVGYDDAFLSIFSPAHVVFDYDVDELADNLGLVRVLRIPSLRSLTLRLNVHLCINVRRTGNVHWAANAHDKGVLMGKLDGWLKRNARSDIKVQILSA